jgi:hypothetical protein
MQLPTEKKSIIEDFEVGEAMKEAILMLESTRAFGRCEKYDPNYDFRDADIL